MSLSERFLAMRSAGYRRPDVQQRSEFQPAQTRKDPMIEHRWRPSDDETGPSRHSWVLHNQNDGRSRWTLRR